MGRIVQAALIKAASGNSTSNYMQTNPNVASGTSGPDRSVIARQTEYARNHTLEEGRQNKMAEFVDRSGSADKPGEEAGPVDVTAA